MKREDGTTERPVSELIDTLWNVNTVRKSALYFFLSELIDTLWNVNNHAPKLFRRTNRELIDTLWNVNLVGVPDKSTTLSN